MEGKKKNWVFWLIVLAILILCCCLGVYAGIKYADYENEKVNKNYNQQKETNNTDIDKKDENDDKKSWMLDVKELCGENACDKTYNEVINGVEYEININLEKRTYEMNKSYGFVKVNDLEIEETDLSSISEIAILENGLIAVRTSPTYVLKTNTEYYDGTKLIASINNYTMEDYPIDSNYGYYDDCQSNDENDSDDSNQRADIYFFEISNSKNINKELIGSYSGVFCSVQS